MKYIEEQVRLDLLAGMLLRSYSITVGQWLVSPITIRRYGPIQKSYDNHPNYQFHRGDVKNTDLMKELAEDCD